MSAPALAHAFDVSVEVGASIEIGETGTGARRVIPIVGGMISGRLSGRVLPGGADYQTIRASGLTEVHARYVLALDDGAAVYVENTGLRFGPPDALARLRAGEQVDPALIYFRTVPRFETAAPAYGWLTRHVFVASGARHPDRVELSVWQVL